MAEAKTTDQLLRARLKEMMAERDKLQAEVQPHRDAIKAAQKKIQAIKDQEIEPLAVKLRAANEKLFPLENEIAKVAIVLGGKSMGEAPPPAAA